MPLRRLLQVSRLHKFKLDSMGRKVVLAPSLNGARRFRLVQDPHITSAPSASTAINTLTSELPPVEPTSIPATEQVLKITVDQSSDPVSAPAK